MFRYDRLYRLFYVVCSVRFFLQLQVSCPGRTWFIGSVYLDSDINWVISRGRRWRDNLWLAAICVCPRRTW